MTQHERTHALLTLVARTVRPSYGARRNAADGLRQVRSSRDQSAQAAAALSAARSPGPPSAEPAARTGPRGSW